MLNLDVNYRDTIPAKIEDVFALCADVKEGSKYIKAIEEFEILSDHQVGEGVVYVEKRRLLGIPWSIKMKILESVQNRRLHVTSIGSKFNASGIMEFSEDGDKTIIDMSFQTRLTPVIAALVYPFRKLIIRWQISMMRNNILGIKKVLK